MVYELMSFGSINIYQYLVKQHLCIIDNTIKDEIYYVILESNYFR